MKATITKRFLTIGDVYVEAGEEVDVYKAGGMLQIKVKGEWVHDIDPNWFANVAVYRRAKDLGYDN